MFFKKECSRRKMLIFGWRSHTEATLIFLSNNLLKVSHPSHPTKVTLVNLFLLLFLPKFYFLNHKSPLFGQILDFCISVKIIFFKHWRKVFKMSNNAIDVKNCKYHPLAYTQFALNAFYYQIRWLRLTQGFFIRVFWKPRPEPQILFNIIASSRQKDKRSEKIPFRLHMRWSHDFSLQVIFLPFPFLWDGQLTLLKLLIGPCLGMCHP